MSIKTYHNNKSAVSKDIVSSRIVNDSISECAIYLQKDHSEPCSSDETIGILSDIISVKGSPSEIISSAKERTGCATEECVLKTLETDLGADRVKSEIEARFKLKGPNGIELLSNFDIDNTLIQWTNKFTDFFPYNFNMLNYIDYSIKDGYVVNEPDSLARISFSDLYYGKVNIGDKPAPKGGYRCAGCVINSDKYQGRGKHWMALFLDARGADEWSVEFFNSSGNGPAPEFINWVLKISEQMEEVASKEKLNVKITQVKSSSIRHQQSKTECGLYSLFYIYARLNNVPYTYFHSTPVPDQLMFELRQHLFKSGKKQPGVVEINGIPKFDFDKYKSEIKVQWEEKP
jgi:hypothetical protein